MKKQTFQLLVLLGMMVTLVYGCQKDPILQEKMGEENTILYEDPALLENISPNFYDNHFYRIELLGQNEELEDLVSRISDRGIGLEKLNIYGTKKHFFNHSDVWMYSVPYNASSDRIVVYQYDGISEVMVASYEEGGTLNRFSMKTTDGQLYYSFQVNEQGQFGNIITAYNPMIEAFNQEVYELHLAKFQTGKDQSVTKAKAPCCRKEDGVRSCMDCTTSYFRESFLGSLALAAFGLEAYIAVGVSCINAGPGAVC